MDYLFYFKNLNFESLIGGDFLLPFFGIIIILKIISFVIFALGSQVDDDDDKYQVTVFSNMHLYIIISFISLTVYDYNNKYDEALFRYSNLDLFQGTKDNSLQSSLLEDNDKVKSEYLNESKTNVTIADTEYIPNEAELLRLEKDPEYARIFTQLCKEAENIKDLSEVMSFEICGHEDGNCQWCGDLFQQNKLLKPSFIAVGEDIGIFPEEEGWNSPTVYRYVMDYKKGIKFQCIVEKKKFCSLKCEKEFINDR
ncbi:hypothetical protein [Chryseobacterium wangxinyae]|uniref:hypothetical protein n=1 Tax=Chryseobacterium sp. CY353 TaxID=2997334 RepID=UPI00226E9A8C|nr:hypothetical protein [Chryseobacterium sp. CY353]MCY0970271.1 hypothetical protein [Chryseobacterium sp. CY353]